MPSAFLERFGTSFMRIAAVIVAGGRGHRAGAGKPKQYRSIKDEPLLRRTLRSFDEHQAVSQIVPVIHNEDMGDYADAARGFDRKCIAPVLGGATRQLSVFAGLQAIETSAPDFVLVHDAVRPLFSQALIGRAIDAMKTASAAVPVLPVTDTVKRIDAAGNVAETLDRNELRLTQTPQIFSYAKLLAAHRSAAAKGLRNFSDDASLAEWAGIPVATFPGETGNVKFTTADDFLRAEALTGALFEFRNGTGFDIHAFGPGDHVTLGGVKIPYTKSLSGHSDADVLLHALTDAVLGAIGEADIGAHFPPSDGKWRGAASEIFLRHAISLLEKSGGNLVNLDATLLCEAPKIGPHRDAIRASIAAITGIDISRIAVKATTMEKLGFIGRGEGIAAMASATVRLPMRTA
jgi:2-C-methyl-D-erythritol 4-phosphate cytidylyltransferase/2-C-methyl-D-erythritol 2,4-cyclodiphosphate synthase